MSASLSRLLLRTSSPAEGCDGKRQKADAAYVRQAAAQLFSHLIIDHG
jgi:hypothetical protein